MNAQTSNELYLRITNTCLDGFYLYLCMHTRIDNTIANISPASWPHRTSSVWIGRATSTAARTRRGTAAPRTLRTTQ